MKKQVSAVLLVCAMIAAASPAMADRYLRANNDHPTRIVGYVAHAVGLIPEYLVMRPIHWVVSQPDLDVVFGHQPNTKVEEGTYMEWTHGDYTPSISEERQAKPAAPAEKK